MILECGNGMTRRGWRARCFRGVLLAGLVGVGLAVGSLPARAQRQKANTPGTSPAEDRLHQDMLRLRMLQRQGNRAGAIRLGQELLRDFPGEHRVEDALLDLYRIERRDRDLIQLLTVRVEREPHDLTAARELGTLYLARQQADEALKMFKKVIAANPRDEARYRTAAVVFRSHRLNDVAADMYREGRKAIGREVLFAAELAQLEEARGDPAAAVGEYLLLVMDEDRRGRARDKIVELLDRAEAPKTILASVLELRRKHPKSWAVQDVAATVYLHSKRYEDAFDAIQKADRYAEDQGELLLEFGRLALKTPENEPADIERARIGVRALKRILEQHPGSSVAPDASRLIGEGLVSVARAAEKPEDRTALLQEAIDTLDASMKTAAHPEQRRDALALRSMILFEDLGRKEEARETLENLIRLQKEDGESHHVAQVQLGTVLASMDRMAEARKVFEEIAASVPREKVPLQLVSPHGPKSSRRAATPESIGAARARFQLAELDAIEGNYEAAIDGYAAVAEDAPEDRLANDCLDLALLLNEASFYDPPEALQSYSQYRRALIHRDPDATRAALQAIVEDHPGASLRAVALFELARNFTAAKQYDVAQAYYERLVGEHAQHRLAPRALEAIGDLQLLHLGQPEASVASYERILLEYPDDLFLDEVRQKLLGARRLLESATEDHRENP